MRSQKVFTVTPTTGSAASYTIGLYFTSAELGGFDPATLKIAKTDAATLAGANGTNTIIAPTTYVAYGSGYVFTASFSGFSQFFLVDPSVVLPITLLSFNGNLDNDRVLLQWQTASEHGSQYFDIEKSTDGASFYSLGKQAALGTTNTTANYQFTDLQPDMLNYYRLKLVDVDGHFVYSATLLIRDAGVAQRLWIDGNPFHDHITVHLARLPQGVIRTELLDLSGRRITTQEFSSATQVRIDLTGLNLSSGMYVLRTYADHKIYINKLVKQ